MSTPPPLPDNTDKKSGRSLVLRLFLVVVRLVAYPALLIVLVGFAGLVVLPMTGLCVSNGPGFTCESETAQNFADFILSVLLLSVFTGFPLLLAAVGVIVSVVDIRAWLKNRR